MKSRGVPISRKEGSPGSGWLLMDFSDVIVHLFAEQERELYALERLWQQAPAVLRVQ